MSCENCIDKKSESQVCDSCGEPGCDFCLEDGLCDKCSLLEKKPWWENDENITNFKGYR